MNNIGNYKNTMTMAEVQKKSQNFMKNVMPIHLKT